MGFDACLPSVACFHGPPWRSASDLVCLISICLGAVTKNFIFEVFLGQRHSQSEVLEKHIFEAQGLIRAPCRPFGKTFVLRLKVEVKTQRLYFKISSIFVLNVLFLMPTYSRFCKWFSFSTKVSYLMSIDMDIFENNTFALKSRFYPKTFSERRQRRVLGSIFIKKIILKHRDSSEHLAGHSGRLSFFGSKLR